MSVNGRKLSKKERKRYCAKQYIYSVMIVQNGLWITALALNWDYYTYEIDENTMWGLVAVVGLAALLDSRLIGKKYFKYMCKDTYDADDDSFEKHDRVVDPEAQFPPFNAPAG